MIHLNGLVKMLKITIKNMKFNNLSLEDKITLFLLLVFLIYGYNIDYSLSLEQSILNTPSIWVS